MIKKHKVTLQQVNAWAKEAGFDMADYHEATSRARYQRAGVWVSIYLTTLTGVLKDTRKGKEMKITKMNMEIREIPRLFEKRFIEVKSSSER